MPNHHRQSWLIVGVLSLFSISVLAAMVAYPTRAQTAATIALTPPDPSQFPRLITYLDAHDAQGGFMHGLLPENVAILEDGLQLPVDVLEEIHPGVQFVIAIAPGDSFLIRDSLGVTRYEYFRQAFLAEGWGQGETSSDDFSLLIAGGPQVLHTSDAGEIRRALEAYQLPAEALVPNLETIAQALEIAADPVRRPGMERAVLFITAPQMTDVTVGMQSLAARASQQNIRVYVWLLSAADYFTLPGADQLRIPVEQTSGQFFAFSGVEAVPNLETYLEPLRHIYRLEYTSRIVTAGAHQVAAQVSFNEETLVSAAQPFDMNLQPPTVLLVAPPVQIVRSYPTQAEQVAEQNGAALEPAEQILHVDIGFPDGYERSFSRTSLFVDGALAAENTAPPFDQFTWDLSSYAEDGSHTLRVEAVDSLGMSSESPTITTQISVPRPEQSVLAAFSRQRTLVAGLIVLLAASVLVLVLILGGRIRPKAVLQGEERATLKTKMGRKQEAERRKDPVTQPVKIAIEPPQDKQTSSSGWISRLHWPQRKAAPRAFAYLTPLAEAGQATLPAPLPVTADEVVLGSDPMQAHLPIPDPSVEAQHARLARHMAGFLLQDLGTVAGTWVNYDPAGPEGVFLTHGDIVHIGGVGFRFTLREPGRLRKPVAVPLEVKH